MVNQHIPYGSSVNLICVPHNSTTMSFIFSKTCQLSVDINKYHIQLVAVVLLI